MRTFAYTARDTKNVARAGVIEAPDEKTAAVTLRQHGLFPIELKVKTAAAIPIVSQRFGRVPYSELVSFTRQLATMINAGLTLSEALDILGKQSSNKKLAGIIIDVHRQIEGGQALATALSTYPEVFSQIYVSLVRAGESAGVLDTVLARLADNLEKEREFRQKIRGALVYPAIIVIAMIGVIFVMLVFVIPKLTDLYKEFGASLPLPTQILITASNIAVKFWWLLAILLFGGVWAFQKLTKQGEGRKLKDEMVFKIPIWGNLRKNALLTEFARTLTLLVGAGIPILEALRSVAQALDNVKYEKALDDAAVSVERGLPLATALAQPEYFPPIITQMVKTGEETGKLDEVLGRVAKFFESEAEQGVKNLTTAMEPLILIMLAFGVGFLILSVILPIYNLTAQF